MSEHRCVGGKKGTSIWGTKVVCGLTAKHEHQGKFFCKIHHPPTIKAKREARNTMLDAKWDLRVQKEKAEEESAAETARRAECFPALLEALEKIAAIENKDFGGEWEEIEEARAIAIAAIQSAKGKP